MVDSPSRFAHSASGLSPVNVLGLFPNDLFGRITVVTEVGFLTGPTMDFGQWISDKGAFPNPTLITEGSTIVLSNPGWTGLNIPTALQYVRAGGEKWLTPDGRRLADFSLSVPYP